jgi:hypothetical protein
MAVDAGRADVGALDLGDRHSAAEMPAQHVDARAEPDLLCVARSQIDLPSHSHIADGCTKDAADIRRFDTIAVDDGDAAHTEMHKLGEDDGACAAETDHDDVEIAQDFLASCPSASCCGETTPRSHGRFR